MKYNVEVDILAGTSHSIMLQNIKSNSKILEFGSASGYMTQYMKQTLNCQVVCIEIDPDAAEKAKEYAELMVVSDIEKMQWVEEIKGLSFDYILFADVLEHLRNPDMVLSKATEFLSDEGTVMTSIPNISHNAIIMELMEGRFDYKSVGLLDDTHVHFFTRKTVLELLDKVGLEPCAWFTTMRRPETTEFHQNYSKFPITVQNYLKNRVDADVYQFVTFSKRRKKSEKLIQFLDNQETNYLDQDYCQLYWGEESLFNEGDSLQKPLLFNCEKKVFEFDIPEGSSGNLRFDPSNTPVYGEITQFNIYSTDELGNKIIIKDTKDFDFLKFGSGMVKLKGNEKVRFISTNNDPVIIIDDFVMDRQKKYWVEVGVNITNKLEVIVNEVIGDFNEVIGDFLVLEDKHIGQIKELEWKISDTHEKQSLIKQELEKLEGNFKLLQDEHHQLERDHKELIREREQLILDLKKVSEALQIKQQSLDIKENLLDELMNSMSWKITKIFRILAKKFRAK